MGCIFIRVTRMGSNPLWDLGDHEIQVHMELKWEEFMSSQLTSVSIHFRMGIAKLHFPKVKMGSIFGHRIDYDGVGVLRDKRPTPSKKLTQVTPPPPPRLIFNLQLCRRLGWVSFCKDVWDCYRGCTSQLLGNLFSLFPVKVPEVFAKLMTWLSFFLISKVVNETTKRSDNYESEPK